MDLLWDGDGRNPNAALTVMRHFDSASVVQGLLGERPQTVMLIGYPLLERIHYLLVAGFDVYGNVGHQLTTRLYMDFLRTEGEMNFFAFLPLADAAGGARPLVPRRRPRLDRGAVGHARLFPASRPACATPPPTRSPSSTA